MFCVVLVTFFSLLRQNAQNKGRKNLFSSLFMEACFHTQFAPRHCGTWQRERVHGGERQQAQQEQKGKCEDKIIFLLLILYIGHTYPKVLVALTPIIPALEHESVTNSTILLQ